MIPQTTLEALGDAIEIDALNVGLGDLKLSFDPEDKNDVKEAKRTIDQMLKAGYALFVQEGKSLLPIEKFDAEKGMYVLKKAAKSAHKEVPAKGRKVTSVPRSAGG